MSNKARMALERLCLERGEDFASLSRMIGRNPAYIQQFIRRGVPRRLGEEERRRLARYFSVAEAVLGGPEEEEGFFGMVRVPALPVRASAGPGAFALNEQQRAFFAFEERWLKKLTSASSEDLSLIVVEGDSMAPTLATAPTSWWTGAIQSPACGTESMYFGWRTRCWSSDLRCIRSPGGGRCSPTIPPTPTGPTATPMRST